MKTTPGRRLTLAAIRKSHAGAVSSKRLSKPRDVQGRVADMLSDLAARLGARSSFIRPLQNSAYNKWR